MKPRIDPQRWKQIDDLLDVAIGLEPEKRSSYLDQVCGNDQDLRKKLEELLKSDQHAEDFISLPVLDPDSEYVDHKIELYERDVIADRYELVSRLGLGGMGEVWLAFDLKLRVQVVLKTLHFHLNRSPHRIEGFRREVLNARNVISPNVCRIFDLVIDDDRDFISMEHIDGMTLAAMLKSTGPLPLSKARDIASQFLSGLQAIHAAGLVHCDLKPENIMITHTGRVVVMDFGIAKQIDQTRSTISGTPAYMSPEQLCGAEVDPKTDIFAAGIILAEMIHPDRIVTDQTREEIWNRIRQDPPELADSPWKSVIARAVAVHPEDRFHSAASLLRSLEEATEQVQTQHERSPYPGLASYRSEDADYFFGREQEVEAVIKKLKQLHFLALVGASGSGKTSFLQAGLIPALPEGWSCIFCVPSDSPHLNLKHALIREFSGDPQAMQRLSRFDETEVAVQLLHQWRRKYAEVVLIIDRFEELFTLNGTDVQSRFADLIGNAVVDWDIHVLLSMRDDFLIRCHHYPPLAPIFSGLTPLESLSGPSLRRALVQPALKCGYAFEDETLMDEIVADVEKERGALPLMAFAAAQLWKKRDRDSGVLTRKAYKEIGGAAGALAQHAEKTLERIGADKRETVREIFRNLITAQNTRAARDTEELMSVFADQQKAEEVLRILIDARLLTSFEEPPQDGEKPKRRVEMIHESLLAAWPRLVRWQTQEAESAQFRDQLRQASQFWAERSRLDDLLWTGTAFAEFELWRQRYPGGLTSTEEAFAQAMSRNANKKRRRRKMIVTAAFVVLLSFIAAIGNFWRDATVARDDAVLQSRRVEAVSVLNVARAMSDADPTTKLAYAIASLERADTPQARRFALQAVAEGPVAHVYELGRFWTLERSPDAKWIAVTRLDGSIELISRDGSATITVQKPFLPQHFIPWNCQFSADSEFLTWTWREDPRVVKVWSISQKKIVRTFQMEGLTICLVRGDKAFLISDTRSPVETPFYWTESIVRTWKFDQSEPDVLGSIDFKKTGFDIDSKGEWITHARGNSIYALSLAVTGLGPEKLVGSHMTDVRHVRFHPKMNQIASSDSSEIMLWSLIPGSQNPIRTIHGTGGLIWFDPTGSFLLEERNEGLTQWDLNNDQFEPFVFRSTGTIIFDKNWMAVGDGANLVFFPKKPDHPYVLSSPAGASNTLFTPDGNFLISTFKDGIRMWSLPGEKKSQSRILWNSNKWGAQSIDLDPAGRYVLASTLGDGVHLISIAASENVVLKSASLETAYSSVSFSSGGESAAAALPKGIEVWDLQSGKSRIIEQSKAMHFRSLKYANDATLVSGDSEGTIYQWNLKNDSFKILRKGNGYWVSSIAVSNDGKQIATVTISVKGVFELSGATSELVLHNLQSGKSRAITSHGNRVFSVAFDPGGTRLITGDIDGIVRVGQITGDAPHLLLGHTGTIRDVVVDPGGQWIASTEEGSDIRLWQMPQGKPLDGLPYNEFLNHLRSLTNVRVVADKDSPNGYRIQYQPLSGWRMIPDEMTQNH